MGLESRRERKQKSMKTIEERFYQYAVVPVVALEDSKDALPLAEALEEGGLPCAEITFRTEAAEESIRLIAGKRPDMLVGAGTVLSVEQADKAVKAGAKFIVSPGFDTEVVDHCLERGIPVYPGCVTPTEVAQAVKRGLRVIKFFPAEQAGGVPMMQALAAPYRSVKFMPTGGIGTKNLRDYLSFGKVLCCGGTWMVKESLIQDGDFKEIRRLAGEAVQLAASIRTKPDTP